MSILVMIPASGCLSVPYFYTSSFKQQQRAQKFPWCCGITGWPLFQTFELLCMPSSCTTSELLKCTGSFFTETMRQLIPLLLFGLGGIIQGWLWPSVPKTFYFSGTGWGLSYQYLVVPEWPQVRELSFWRTGTSSTLGAHRDVLHFS